MSLHISVSILLIIAAFGAFGQEASTNSTAPLKGWQPSKDCALVMRAGQFVVASTGEDPYLFATDIPDAAGPFAVELRMRTRSAGIGQIFWALKRDRGVFSGKRVANFFILHDNEWHDYEIKLSAPEIGGLRLDPSTAPGDIFIAFVKLKDSAGKTIKVWDLGEGGPPKPWPNANGNAQIRGKFKDSEIVVTTTARLAGAIHSLTWNGTEFVNSADHGRQLQSATNLDCGTPITGETYNPTEAGSRDDGEGPFSTSKLLSISAVGPELKTTIQMAFWLAPGETSGGQPAKNTTQLSNHLVTKRVHIGHGDLANVIEYDAAFALPNEHHTTAVIEALTGYMPPDFKTFLKRNPASGELLPVDDGPGEQEWPLVFSTENGSHAMGIFAPAIQPRGKDKAGYGRFRFAHEKVVKWNCVFRIRDKNGIKPGEYAYKMFVVVGTLDDVKTGMSALAKEFAE